jgi:hypothetical protein
LVSLALALVGAFGAGAAPPCLAQTRVTSLEALRRGLAAGDRVTVVPADGQPIEGRLVRVGHSDIDVRPAGKRTPRDEGLRDVTIRFGDIQSLERPRDSARNGAILGAGIGAGIGGALFLHALVIDRNEMDEWAPAYAAGAAAFTGIGALIGWAADAANSKPHLRFDAPSGAQTTVSVRPLYSRGPGIALAVSFSR